MKKIKWQIMLGTILIGLSALFYSLHYVIFKDVHHIFIYMIGDIAFVPIEVLLVTLIIHRLLQQREKAILMQKMNMVIGTFFSEVGMGLLKYFVALNNRALVGNKYLIVTGDWTDKDFNAAIKFAAGIKPEIDVHSGDLVGLKDYLKEKRVFLMRLLENQNLLEHDSFTDALWAIFHLLDELEARKDLLDLHEKDYQHLAVDINRAYYRLISEWLSYMKHLKYSYPYLFSLAVRTNIFREDPSAEFK
jgi:hypothetical protein